MQRHSIHICVINDFMHVVNYGTVIFLRKSNNLGRKCVIHLNVIIPLYVRMHTTPLPIFIKNKTATIAKSFKNIAIYISAGFRPLKFSKIDCILL